MYSKSFGKIGLSLLQNLAKNDYEMITKSFLTKSSLVRKIMLDFIKLIFRKNNGMTF